MVNVTDGLVVGQACSCTGAQFGSSEFLFLSGPMIPVHCKDEEWEKKLSFTDEAWSVLCRVWYAKDV